MTFLVSIAAFLLAISVLVAFHEYGHYWVARRYGVRVLRFSVGFGRPLLRYVSPSSRTEWVVAAWPLGGYVKMLDRRDGDDIPEALMAEEFSSRPWHQRMAIIAAGPLANLLLAFLIYTFVFVTGEVGRRPLIGHVTAGMPAAAADVRTGDEILAVDGHPIATWQESLTLLLGSAMRDGTVPLEVRRDDGSLAYPTLRVEGILENEDIFATLGMQPLRAISAPIVGETMAESPAAAAGLQPGDRILSLDGVPVAAWAGLTEYIRARPGQLLELELERDGQRLRRSVRTQAAGPAEAPHGRLGILPYWDAALAERLRIEVSYPLGQSLKLGAERTWDISVLTVRVIGELLTGGASLRNISGPVGIAEFAGNSALLGVAAFLSMLALLSVSLGILNLLPVPVLDGGGLVFCAIEAVTRRPLPPQVEHVGQRVGMVMLVALMSLALYNDVARLWSG